MNPFTYGSEYAAFHGVYDYRVLDDGVLALDFADLTWDPLNVLRLHHSDYVYDSPPPLPPLVRAFRIHFKTEAPCTVFCKRDSSWSVLIGNERLVVPTTVEEKKDVTLRLYATPYFVESPSVFREYLRGGSIVAAGDDFFYPHRNGVLYLDASDVPRPGALYMKPTNDDDDGKTPERYRVCFLTSETDERIVATSVLSQWKGRRNVFEIPFYTLPTRVVPKFVDFKPQQRLELPDRLLVARGPIYKRQSRRRPHCLLHDVLVSYRRARSDRPIKDLGIVLDWPLVVSFDGSDRSSNSSDEEEEKGRVVVMLVVNGRRPKRVVEISRPFETFLEYDYVPPLQSSWTPVSFVDDVLQVPSSHFEKVCVDSVVIGFVYRDAFFCFGEPVIEGRASWSTDLNVEHLLSLVADDRSVFLRDTPPLETYRLDDRFALHHVQMQGLPSAWCLTRARDTDPYARQLRLPYLVDEWTSFFRRHFDDRSTKTVRPYEFKLALALTKHEICFRIRLDDDEKREAAVHLTDEGLEIDLSREEAEFLNRVRLRGTEEEEDTTATTDGCIIM